MKFTLGLFLCEQYGRLPSIESMRTDLSGKTVIVLGANAGLGLECARHVAYMMGKGSNAGRLILACRNIAKAETALQSIRDSTGFEGGEIWPIDLTDFASVSAFADKFEREGGGHLDILIENSGIMTEQYRKTKDGWESTIQTNHLGTSLLAILLLPYLLKAPSNPPSPRLTLVSSGLHYLAEVYPEELSSARILEKLNDMDYCTPSVMSRRYNVSKMLNVFFVRALSSRLPASSSLVVNAVNPGYCRSGLGDDGSRNFFSRVLPELGAAIIARTTEEGGRLLVHATVTVDPAKAMKKKDLNGADKKELDRAYPKALHGKYISHCEIKEESDFVISAEGKKAEDRLWDETIAILSKVDARVPLIVQEHLS